MARTLSFQYGSLVIGAGQADDNYHLTGKHRFAQDYQTASLTFEVVVSASTPAAFLTSEAALKAAYRLPDQALTVELGGTARHAFDPADNSGFNVRANTRIVPGPESTDRSARYECSVTVELPANLTGRAGRRSSSVNVSASPSGIRSATIQGVYTALANNAARAQFAQEVDTYANGVLSGLGGTWELVGTPSAEGDDQDKVIRFSRVYQELLFDQASGVRNHAALVNQRLTFQRTTESSNSALGLGSVAPLIGIDVSYAVDVVAAETTDLATLYAGTIRPHILEQAQRIASAGTIVVASESPAFDPVENRIEARLSLVADSGAQFYRAQVAWSEKHDYGVILKPVWNGDPFARDLYQGLASQTRTLRISTVSDSQGAHQLAFPSTIGHAKPPEMPGFIEVRANRSVSYFSVGISANELPMQGVTTSYTYVRANVQNGGASGLGQTRERGSS